MREDKYDEIRIGKLLRTISGTIYRMVVRKIHKIKGIANSLIKYYQQNLHQILLNRGSETNENQIENHDMILNI